jgi:hypothetical protein
VTFAHPDLPQPEREISAERQAERDLCAVIDGFATSDRLYASAIDVMTADGIRVSASPSLRAWARRIQKHLESIRRAPH